MPEMTKKTVIHLDDAITPSHAPIAPRRVSETGVSQQMLVELTVKLLHLHGDQRLVDLARQLRLAAIVVDETLDFLRGERIVELLRQGGTFGDADYGLTEKGRARATEYLRRCRYAGPAPVPVDAYTAQVTRQSVADMPVTQAEVENAYRHMVVSKELRDVIGAAMNSDRPLFLYGPAGAGKTFLAESLVELLNGVVFVPHALVVDGEIVKVFDPMLHRPVHTDAGHGRLDNRSRLDGRWVACKRPVAISGGELSLEMLNLRFDPVAGYYQAPLQVKANNGLYIVDDLGRQQVRPEQLMNRWIVPMDRGRDYLTLHTGSSFEVPFDVKLVFSTNLNPEIIADEAFLRRLGYKIHVGPVSEGEYEQIFRQACEELSLPYRADAFHALLNLNRSTGRPTFACFPRDLIEVVRDNAVYREEAPEVTPMSIAWAWEKYFASEWR
jgi:hypothetical protein